MTDHDHGPHLVGSGTMQEAPPARIQHAKDALERAEAYAIKSETHLWLVILTHRANDSILDATDDPDPTAMPILDLDTLMGQPAVACFVCEAMYEPRLRRRRCPGPTA